MSVVSSNKVSIGRCLAKRPPRISSISTVVHVESIGAKRGSNALAIVDKAAAAVNETARLPGVVGCRAADDDFCALVNECSAGLDQVEGVGVHSCGYAVESRLADLGTPTRADGATVVGGVQGAAIVVAELDDDNIVRLDSVDDVVEAAFDGVGAGATATDSSVDDSCG